MPRSLRPDASFRIGRTIESSCNLDLTYRVELPWQTDASLSIYNLLDKDPSFARNALAYDSVFGRPLGRNLKMSFSRRF